MFSFAEAGDEAGRERFQLCVCVFSLPSGRQCWQGNEAIDLSECKRSHRSLFASRPLRGKGRHDERDVVVVVVVEVGKRKQSSILYSGNKLSLLTGGAWMCSGGEGNAWSELVGCDVRHVRFACSLPL